MHIIVTYCNYALVDKTSVVHAKNVVVNLTTHRNLNSIQTLCTLHLKSLYF